MNTGVYLIDNQTRKNCLVLCLAFVLFAGSDFRNRYSVILKANYVDFGVRRRSSNNSLE